MKFIEGIVIYTSALLMISACTKTDADLVQKEPISFSNPIIQPNTRTIIEDTNYPTTESFKVWAQWDQNGFVHWNGNGLQDKPSAMYMNGLEVSYKGGYWATKDTYYWPKDGGLTFAAYSPFSLNASYTQEGLKIDKFKVDSNAPTDILYSKRAYNCRYNPDGQNIVFYHALAKVRFKIVADYDGVKLVSLKVRSICTTGNFNENIIEDEAAPDTYKTNANKRKWTIVENKGNEIVADYLADFNGKIDIPQKGVGLSVEPLTSQSILVMPQRFAQSAGPMGNVIDATHAFFEIKYTDKSGTVHTSTEDKAKIASFTPVWEPGKSYTYTITIGSNKINFNVDGVEEWGTEENHKQ